LYNSFDSVKEAETSHHLLSTTDMLDYLAQLKQPGVPPHSLPLKVGAICSIMRNLDVEKGLVKNTRVVIVALRQRYVEVRLLSSLLNSTAGISSSDANQTFCLPRIVFEFKPSFAPWTVQRRQIFLRLAYATTFNSCQGLTLDRCVLDLRTPVFAHGQLYTSISRVRHRDHIRVFFDSEEEIGSTTNIVYRELLL
jgi:hypothetical protein